MENNTEELVEHPNHYKWMEDEIGVEPYNIGNCLKYLFRAGKKLYNNKDSRESYIIDLQKAKEYIDFELDRCYNEMYKINIEGSVADKKIVL